MWDYNSQKKKCETCRYCAFLGCTVSNFHGTSHSDLNIYISFQPAFYILYILWVMNFMRRRPYYRPFLFNSTASSSLTNYRKIYDNTFCWLKPNVLNFTFLYCPSNIPDPFPPLFNLVFTIIYLQKIHQPLHRIFEIMNSIEFYIFFKRNRH